MTGIDYPNELRAIADYVSKWDAEMCKEAAAEIERLRAALGPFAKAAEEFPTAKPEEEICRWHPSTLNFGHLFAARRALSGEPTP